MDERVVLKNLASTLASNSFPLPWRGHWIQGDWVVTQGGKARESHNPSTGDLLLTTHCDRATVVRALDAAEQSQARLFELRLSGRMAQMARLRHGLADFSEVVQRSLVLEGGKPAREAAAEFAAGLRYLDGLMVHAETILGQILAPARTSIGGDGQDVVALPIGVTVAFIPFSTPLTSFLTALGAAMLAGAPIVFISSSHAALSATVYTSLLATLDLPPGSVQALMGHFDVLKHVLSDRRVAAIAFTGSREHCEVIRKESYGFVDRQLMLQSGGKNSVIVHSSADLTLATQVVLDGVIRGAGQLCTSTSRVFVYRNMIDPFVEQLVAQLSSLRIGPPKFGVDAAEDVDMGPLYSEKALDKFLRFQTMAHREAISTPIWGKVVEPNRLRGHFVAPGVHLFQEVDPRSAYQSNVLFCPDLAIYPYDTLDNAIQQTNATDAPFVVSFVGDRAAISDRRHHLRAPNIVINGPTTESDTSLPLGGRGQSGHHRFTGPGLGFSLTWPQALVERD